MVHRHTSFDDIPMQDRPGWRPSPAFALIGGETSTNRNNHMMGELTEISTRNDNLPPYRLNANNNAWPRNTADFLRGPDAERGVENPGAPSVNKSNAKQRAYEAVKEGNVIELNNILSKESFNVNDEIE